MNISHAWQRVARNHALEHATIALLIKRGITTIIAGNSTPGGFYVYGDLSTEQMVKAVEEALQRLQHGERDLAISAFCGTNLVVAALLSGIGAAVVLGVEYRWRRIPLALAATVAALVMAPSVGSLAQRYLTTDSNLDSVTVTNIEGWGKGPRSVHRISTRQQFK